MSRLARKPSPAPSPPPARRVRVRRRTGLGLLVVTGTAVLGVLAASPALAAGPAAGEAGQPPADCLSSVPFVAGSDGYDTFRVPAVVTAPSGTLLAFAEGRVAGAGDTGDIDVVLRRSTDGGCTWGPLSVVASGDGDTRGNPAPVFDPATGRLVLVTCFNGGRVGEEAIRRGEVAPEESRRVFVQTSDDEGATFSEPREITDEAKRPDWRWYATGPGHAIALTRGPHAGRLLVPANHSAAPPPGSPDTGAEDRYYGSHALYSDDGGASWELGYVDDSYEGALNSNESSVAELPDGRLYFSVRDQNGTDPGARLGGYSSDGGESLDGPLAPQVGLERVPVVQGSVLRLPGRQGPLLFSGPSEPNARRALTVWRSDDAGASFRPEVTVSAQPAAYSDLVELDRRTVGLLYETGLEGPYETVEFRRIDIGRG
ncbi:sialidase family protein [Streptomyces triticirhizae]|uniref:exo-alpha-sialidase n=1 Tax=Streptomyces triticirhizae TaxID=2483353 RepID=A0A3M2LKH3_9ACTN|nr:sialidase family protein [Streptomyces triticirhizae]RMI37989.1 exo-alpha-sialidase [Streptomyces triticirhizae]